MRFIAVVLGLLGFAFSSQSFAQTDPSSLSGITIDDTEAELVGEWKSSTSTKPYLGESYIHDQSTAKGEKSAAFTFRVPVAGEYHLLIAYTSGSNRALKVPITVHSVDGKKTIHLNEKQPTQLGTGFTEVGKFDFSDTADAKVLIETNGTSAYVIVDGIRLLTASELAVAVKDEKSARPVKVVAKKTPNKKPAKPKPKPPQFVRPSTKQTFARLTPEELDSLLTGMDSTELEPVDDVTFLRRVSLDLIGRQPSLDEYRVFLANESDGRREQAIDRLLSSETFGQNWGNYWSDVMAARQPVPQLTYLNYKPFRAWLAQQFNTEAGWDETVFRMLTPIGLIGDGPAGSFVGFHQGERNKLAGETARVFLGVKIACAQCHDHPFVDMPQETFHGMAAFFARTSVKLPWNDSNQIAISSSSKGEHKMPGGKSEMQPTVYRGDSYKLGLPDLERREKLAYWVVHSDNPFFARSFVNHVQARLMGRGFFDPIDDLGDNATPLNPDAHEALAQHFVASGFNAKDLFRVIVSTRTYQSQQPLDAINRKEFTGATAKKLRGDEVFDSLVAAIELPNIDKKVKASTGATRFPPPPKSTRDLVNEAFSFDPSTRDELVTRTMTQAIFLMNNDQIHQQIDAKSESTMLAKLLKDESNNQLVVDSLYARVLARQPTDSERKIVLGHVASVKNRGAAFEDVLWSLLNSAEFTTRK